MTWPGGSEIAAGAVVASPSITASHSLLDGAYGFDLNESNYAVVQTDASPAWVQIDFGSAQKISQIRFRGGPDGAGSHTMALKTSPDASTWTTIASWTGQTYYAALSPWFDVNRSDVRYIRFERSDSNNYVRLYYMGVKLPADSLSIDPDELCASPGMSGAPAWALTLPGLAASADLSVSEIFHGWAISSDPLAASPGLSAGFHIALAIPEISAAPALGANPLVAIPAQLAASAAMSVADAFPGWLLTIDPLAASSGISAGLHIDLVVPGLAAAPGLSAGTLIAILAEQAALAAMSVADVVSFGSSDFVVTYICKLTPQPGSAYSAITLPMSSFQGRFKSGDPSFLSVVIPGDDYATAISNRHDPDNPPELSVYMVKTCIGGYIISEQLMAVDLEDVKTYEGGTNISIELEGHRTNTYSAKPVSLTGASYKNMTGGKLRYRCQPDLFLRPGDTVTVNGDTFTADSISIAMAVDSQTMEVAEA
jgi:hypothetical protein